MKGSGSLVSHLLEFLIAGAIFTALVFFGLHVFNFKLVQGDEKPSPKETIIRFEERSANHGEKSPDPIISTPLPSQEELLRQLIGAKRREKRDLAPRQLAPWEKQVQEITGANTSPAEKTQRLLSLAQTLTGEEQARVYATATSVAPPALFQQQLYPMIWSPATPAPVARVLATGVITQPDPFKFSSLLALMKHPDEETRAMAESVLWAYFPDEPTNNYPQAVQRFLGGIH